MYVAGPIHTFQLARADESGRLSRCSNILPVVPDDIILHQDAADPRAPRGGCT